MTITRRAALLGAAMVPIVAKADAVSALAPPARTALGSGVIKLGGIDLAVGDTVVIQFWPPFGERCGRYVVSAITDTTLEIGEGRFSVKVADTDC